jgi:lipopolysaccharide/colanic/teichoic acid biosynthesis glycosyltransferase
MSIQDGSWSLECEREHGRLVKRTCDVIGSIVGLVLFAPIFAILFLIIRFDSPGPAIFRQSRIGLGGRMFTCLKFRTMYSDADETVHQLYIQHLWRGEGLSAEPNATYKLANDIRVTRFGRWLRRTSLDELPQLINVLRGDMSIVGPRPALPYEIEHYQTWHHERHKVKPGITGLWQVRGRGCLSPNDMLAMDVEYARTWTLWTDMKLIALTIPAVLRARGAR